MRAIKPADNPPQADATPAPVPDAPSYQSLAQSHNDRVAKLQHMYATGSIEFRWKDDKGSHFENAHAELWLSLPRRTALRIDKVGEVVIWVGSDEERYWFFDLLSKETSLRVGRHDEPMREIDAAAGLGLGPLALLALLALTPLPDGGESPPVTFDSARKAWMIEVPGNRHLRRMWFDVSSLLPSRVEIINDAGQVQVSSSLREYRSVTQVGMSPLAFPKLATLVDIFTADDDSRNGSVKLALDEMTGDVEDQPMDRVFDLARLNAALKPQSIQGDPGL